MERANEHIMLGDVQGTDKTYKACENKMNFLRDTSRILLSMLKLTIFQWNILNTFHANLKINKTYSPVLKKNLTKTLRISQKVQVSHTRNITSLGINKTMEPS